MENKFLVLCKQIIENKFPIFTTKPEKIHEAFYLDEEQTNIIALRCDMFYYIIHLNTRDADKHSYKEFDRLYPEFETDKKLKSIPSYMINPVMRNYDNKQQDDIVFDTDIQHQQTQQQKGDIVFDYNDNNDSNDNIKEREVKGF